MITPSPATIAAYLTLPLGARQALAEHAQGPGWLAFPDSHADYSGQTHLYQCRSSRIQRFVSEGAVWLPCSDAETLRAWAGRLTRGAWDIDDTAMLLAGRLRDGLYREWCANHDGTLDSRLRAAAECYPHE